jgi:uncharacterized protein YjbI with pentapeptide repeats
MDTYLLSFLRDEVALKSVEQISQWQQTFAHLIGVMLRQGMPMEKIIDPPLKFQQANQWAINAEEALLAALNSCSRVTKDLSTVDWPTLEAFGAWVGRLQGQRLGAKNVVALQSLSHLNLDDSILHLRDFFGSSLEGASLKGASLELAILGRASLKEASLVGASLGRASLKVASLERANLQGANLQGASLEGRIFRRRVLRGRVLRGRVLMGQILLRPTSEPSAGMKIPDGTAS